MVVEKKGVLPTETQTRKSEDKDATVWIPRMQHKKTEDVARINKKHRSWWLHNSFCATFSLQKSLHVRCFCFTSHFFFFLQTWPSVPALPACCFSCRNCWSTSTTQTSSFPSPGATRACLSPYPILPSHRAHRKQLPTESRGGRGRGSPV